MGGEGRGARAASSSMGNRVKKSWSRGVVASILAFGDMRRGYPGMMSKNLTSLRTRIRVVVGLKMWNPSCFLGMPKRCRRQFWMQTFADLDQNGRRYGNTEMSFSTQLTKYWSLRRLIRESRMDFSRIISSGNVLTCDLVLTPRFFIICIYTCELNVNPLSWMYSHRIATYPRLLTHACTIISITCKHLIRVYIMANIYFPPPKYEL